MSRKQSVRKLLFCSTILCAVCLILIIVQFNKTKNYAKKVEEKRENTLEWLQSQKEKDANLYVSLLTNNPYAKVEDKLHCLLEDSFSNIVNIHIKGYTDERVAMLQLQPLFWIESQLENETINNIDAYRLLLLFCSEEDSEDEEFMDIIQEEAYNYLPSPDDEVEMNRLHKILKRLSSFLDSLSEENEQAGVKPLVHFFIILKNNLSKE